jgi:hypothetical protein
MHLALIKSFIKTKKKINNHKLVYILFFILCINLLKRQIIKTKIVLF